MRNMARQRFALLLMPGLVLIGCGQSPPPRTLVAPQPEVTAAPALAQPVPGKLIPTTADAPKFAASKKTRSENFGDSAYLGGDVVGLIVAHPRQLTTWPMYVLAKSMGLLDEMIAKLPIQDFNPDQIERVTIVIDQAIINVVSRSAGLQVLTTEEDRLPDESPHIDPTLIVTLVNPVDRAKIAAMFRFEGDEGSFEGQTYLTGRGLALWSAGEMTFVFGPVPAVKRMIATKLSGSGGHPSIAAQLDLTADLTMAFNLDSQSGLIQQAVDANPIPGIRMVQLLTSLSLHLNLTGKPSAKLVDLAVTTVNEESAAMLAGLLQGALEQGKQFVQQTPLPQSTTDDVNAAIRIAHAAVESANITQAASRIEFSVSIPEGFDKLPELLKLTLERTHAGAQAQKKISVLREIGLAFHNRESAFQSFPAADEKGLSWRVHLLPYLGHGDLYVQFKLDEPWDSEHNKLLIDKMPDVFKSEGVTESGMTSFHVFTGPGSPFADGKAPKVRDFTDGLSNTILVVEAGSDVADVWTKPGGLDFDPTDPVKSLGTLSQDTFRAAMADGSSRDIPKTIDSENLRRAIQIADGESVQF